MLKDLGQVGTWLSRQGFDAADLSEEGLRDYLADRQEAGRRQLPGPRGMLPLLTFLRESGASPVPQAVRSPLEVLLVRYLSWMAQERGLSPATMLRCENTARRFPSQRAVVGGVFTPQGLTGADLNAFLLRECARVSAGSAKGRVAELRSLMRFLHLDGVMPVRLGAAVPLADVLSRSEWAADTDITDVTPESGQRTHAATARGRSLSKLTNTVRPNQPVLSLPIDKRCQNTAT